MPSAARDLPSARFAVGLRKALGLTQPEVAALGGLTRWDVLNVEVGRNKATSARLQDGLALAFRLTRKELTAGLQGTLPVDDAAELYTRRGTKRRQPPHGAPKRSAAA